MKKLIAIALLLATPAQADLLQVDFTGTAFYLRTVVPVGFTEPGNISFGTEFTNVQLHLPFTATFLFNTDLGVLSEPNPGTHLLVGAMLSASLTIIDPLFGGTWNYPYIPPSSAFLRWSDTQIGASTDYPDYYYLSAFTSATPGLHGQHQFGLCPSGFAPCGVIEQNTAVITNLSNPAPVPGPVAGSLGGVIRVFTALFAAK